jgi:transposase
MSLSCSGTLINKSPEINPLKITRVSGVDVGMRYLAVETDLQNKSKFYSGKQARHKANRYHKARQTLQRKDTRSAKRRLREFQKIKKTKQGRVKSSQTMKTASCWNSRIL